MNVKVAAGICILCVLVFIGMIIFNMVYWFMHDTLTLMQVLKTLWWSYLIIGSVSILFQYMYGKYFS